MQFGKGMALILVLWLIACLSASIGTFVLVSRVESLEGSGTQTRAYIHGIAHAGIDYAVWRLSDPQALSAFKKNWHADGTVYRWSYAGKRLEIRMFDETGKINLNTVDQGVLSKLIHAADPHISDEKAIAAAAAVVQWRQSGAQKAFLGHVGGANSANNAVNLQGNTTFQTIGQLRAVPGMTEHLYRKLLPYLTTYTVGETPDPQSAAAPVLEAIGLDSSTIIAQRAQGTPDGTVKNMSNETLSIESRVHVGPKDDSVLFATVRVNPSRLQYSTYTVLHWEDEAIE